MDFTNEILKNKPNLAKSSIKTYMTCISTIAKKMKLVNPTIETFNDTNTIIEFIQNNFTQINHRKSILTALFVLTLNPIYKEHFMVDIGKVQEDNLNNEMNQKQIDNWIPYCDIVKLWENKKATLNKDSCKEFMDFIILSLMSGIYIPPRRNLDWIELKHKNYNILTENYIDFENSSLVFNIYKTFKIYGRQVIQIPKELNDYLLEFSKYSSIDYLLFNDMKKNKICGSTLNCKINSIFDNKKVGCNILRHSFISEKVLPFLPKLRELNDIAFKMGHSVATQMTYKKCNPNNDSE